MEGKQDLCHIVTSRLAREAAEGRGGREARGLESMRREAGGFVESEQSTVATSELRRENGELATPFNCHVFEQGDNMNESDNRNNGSIHGNRDRKEDEDGGDVGREAAEKVAGLLERCKALQDAANTHSARIKYDSQILSQQATSVVADIKNVRSFINSAQDEINPRLAEKLEEDLFRARSMVYEGDAASLLPAKPNGYFLSTLLGPVNVRAPRNDVRLKVKEEYNSYRDRTAILFLAFPVILLALKNWCWNGCFPALPVQLYQAWLLFFYTSLALRENILRVNGSDIRPWWVYHHYCAMVMALVSLTWGLQGHPSCIRKQQGVRLFLAWAVMQGIAMLLQNRYQRQRLYTRIALGKAGRMDVVWGETSGVKGQIWVLYPLLFLLQIFQFSIGALLLRTSITEDESEWQMVACGLLLLIMAVGNFSNTVATVVAKAKIKAKMKQTKHMIQRMSSPGLVRKSS